MKITVTRSGGFAGISHTTELCTGALDRADASPLEQLATSLPDRAEPPLAGADLYQYDVTVAHADGSRSYTFHGEQNPAADLIARVRELAPRTPPA